MAHCKCFVHSNVCLHSRLVFLWWIWPIANALCIPTFVCIRGWSFCCTCWQRCMPLSGILHWVLQILVLKPLSKRNSTKTELKNCFYSQLSGTLPPSILLSLFFFWTSKHAHTGSTIRLAAQRTQTPSWPSDHRSCRQRIHDTFPPIDSCHVLKLCTSDHTSQLSCKSFFNFHVYLYKRPR